MLTSQEIKETLTAQNTVALTLWGEARGEPLEGLVAVGWVIRNRAQRRDQTWKMVCLAPLQFSCWNEDTSVNHKELMALADQIVTGHTIGQPSFVECRFLADGIMNGYLRDPSFGADHFLTTRLFQEHPPHWAQGQTPTTILGNHVFLRLE